MVGHAGWPRPAQHHEIALRGFKLVKTGLPLGGLDGRARWNEAIFLAAFELEHGGCDAGMARDIDAIVDELMEVEQAVESIACCTARHIIARSEEHTSELQSLMRISYAVFCLKKKKKTNNRSTP